MSTSGYIFILIFSLTVLPVFSGVIKEKDSPFYEEDTDPDASSEYVVGKDAKDYDETSRSGIKYGNNTVAVYVNGTMIMNQTKQAFFEAIRHTVPNFYLDGGRPYIKCLYKHKKECDPDVNENCPNMTRCYLHFGKRGWALGCMSVIHYDEEHFGVPPNLTNSEPVPMRLFESAGCWSHDPNVITDCSDSESDVCDAELREEAPAQFCCCRSSMCNQNVVMHSNEPAKVEEPVPGALEWIVDHMFAICVIILIGVLLAVIGVLAHCSYSVFWVDPKAQRNKGSVSIEDEELMPRKDTCTPQVANFREFSNMEKVSHGRFGVVYRATMTAQEVEEVAVKVFPVNDADSWLSEQEMYNLSCLRNHPAILHYVGTEVRNGECWLITKYHPLGSLYDYLQTHVLSVEQCIGIIVSILDGLTYLHEEKIVDGQLKPTIVHRDMKSRNVLLKNDLSACIADFGLAMKCENGVMSTCDGHGQVGTRRYMSPEVLEGATEFSAAAFRQIDVYAAALILWEVLSRTEAYPQEPMPPYKLPYEDECGSSPSLGEMRECVVVRKLRPTFRKEIYQNSVLARIAGTSEEMWEQEADGRITAGCALERINTLMCTDSGNATVDDCNSSVDSNISTASTAAFSCSKGVYPEGSLSSVGFDRAMSKLEEVKAANRSANMTPPTPIRSSS